MIADPDKEAARKRRLELIDRARADLGLCAKPAICPTDERKTALRSPAQVVHGQRGARLLARRSAEQLRQVSIAQAILCDQGDAPLRSEVDLGAIEELETELSCVRSRSRGSASCPGPLAQALVDRVRGRVTNSSGAEAPQVRRSGSCTTAARTASSGDPSDQRPTARLWVM